MSLDNICVMTDNAIGADNQQERLQHIPNDLGSYLSGFADGEGSFNISMVRRSSDYKNGWKVVASFNISQLDPKIPKIFQQVLECGTIRFRRDGVCYFEVRTITDINGKVCDFFATFPLRSKRQAYRLQLLLQAAELIACGQHLTSEGLREVLKIRDSMVSNRKRKYETADVLQNPQRLYAKLM